MKEISKTRKPKYTKNVYPAFVYPQDCLQCQHNDKMGCDLPNEDITIAMAEQMCPTCRSLLPFDKLNCPLTKEQMLGLLEYINSPEGPSFQYRRTRRYCKANGLAVESLIHWLRGHQVDYDEGVFMIFEKHLPEYQKHLDAIIEKHS